MRDHVPMPTATFRFHGSLNDFLAAARRGQPIVREFEASPGVIDLIQALGVPHPEVDLIVVNDRPVGFDYRVRPDDRIDVFGLEGPLDVLEAQAGPMTGAADLPGPAGRPGLIPSPPDPRRFVLDGHLGRLARYLRMLGFDSRYDRNAADDELARLSAEEGRILLTRDRGLLKRSIVRLGYLVRDDDPRRQLVEVVGRYGLAGTARPFSRCVRCNGDIEPVDRSEVAERLAREPRTLRYFETFGRCVGCGSIYWPGSHFDRMSRLVREIVRDEAPIGDNRRAGDARTEAGSDRID
jgi:uncharacterized protein with PIN domain